MKNKIFFITVLGGVSLLSVSPLQAHIDNTGFYAGLGVGASLQHSRLKVREEANQDRHNINSDSGGAEAFLGYGVDFDNFHSALEANYFLDSHKGKSVSSDSGSQITVSNTVKTSQAYGAAVKLGYYIKRGVLAHLRLGVERRSFKIDTVTKDSNSPDINAKFNITGFAPGIGLRINLTPSWVLETEYRKVFYSSKAKELKTTFTTAVKVLPRVDYVVVRLAYKI